ncbi:DNA methylase N-4/N-6 [Mycobacteroides abscessus subsp. abscessus]|uniref:DNA-methyltransferase n=1 Tax=Mycobacteroides abscessus TaxID=36809 RepID=UPI000927A137|nr:site-specific DNA-methyltransferase [Mycobacteroides abscessus]SHS64921.1 DNA methylase N-4/N-6 [Mycobacteroides abscessus subsp. abscessus]
MITPYYQDDSVTLHHGDCLDMLRADDYGYDWNLGYRSARMFPDNSVDAVITDPPYELAFMGRAWDTSGIAFNPAVWAQCLRILKPGGHLLAFGGSRTWHRLAAAVEDAGFEIRDSIAWLYGSGFPKSMNLPGGLGTALKPAFEPIVVARKPLSGTVAANVLEHGTGALNIDACRIPTGDKLGGGSTTRGQRMKDGWHRPWMDDPDMVAANAERSRASVARSEELGRWPTNVVLDKHQAEALDRQTGVLHSGTMRAGTERQPRAGGTIYGADTRTFAPADTYGDSGGASRFFPVFRYEAKAPTSERPNADGVQHPTVKPLELMRWLVRLVAPAGAVVLEPFAGSGTTAEACVLEDRQCIAIEREADYLPLIVSRLRKPVQAGLFGLEAGA